MKSSPYRWIILAVFMLITLAVEIQWLAHAAVVRPAEIFYKGQVDPASFLNLDFLAMSYMLIFMVMSFPASYIIDTYGIKKALTLGAVLVGIFSLSKAIFALSFVGVVVSQIGLAIAQPFILNAVTAVSVRWFPLEERGLAAGFSALAQYIGIIIAMLVTPLLVGSDPNLASYGNGFEHMLWIYGIVSVVASVAVVLFIKEHPKGFKLTDKDNRQTFSKGVFHILRNRDMQITMLLFFIGLGIFNSISAMTDSISARAGVKDSDGLIGGLMLIGGIIGALILPVLSDKYRKRKLFMVICLAGMVPGVFGLTFAGNLGLNADNTYMLLLASSFVIGFFVMSAGPIGFQYAAEVSIPAPESASQGMLLWFGQLSGLFFVSGMSINNKQYLGSFLILFAVLTVFSLFGVFFLRESPVIRSATGK
jgi:MFS family permease